MSDTSANPQSDGDSAAAEDDLRRHTEAATETPEGSPVSGEPVPREHTEDPAEG
jgi:hypothetical protein